MHIYRDQTFPCPHCGIELVRYDTRDKWRCRSCAGVLVGGAQLAVELGDHGTRALQTLTPSTASRVSRPCPGCHEPMLPVVLEGLEIDRCAEQDLVWFDAGELGRARGLVAEAHADAPFVVQIVDSMFSRSPTDGEP